MKKFLTKTTLTCVLLGNGVFASYDNWDIIDCQNTPKKDVLSPGGEDTGVVTGLFYNIRHKMSGSNLQYNMETFEFLGKPQEENIEQQWTFVNANHSSNHYNIRNRNPNAQLNSYRSYARVRRVIDAVKPQRNDPHQEWTVEPMFDAGANNTFMIKHRDSENFLCADKSGTSLDAKKKFTDVLSPEWLLIPVAYKLYAKIDDFTYDSFDLSQLLGSESNGHSVSERIIENNTDTAVNKKETFEIEENLGYTWTFNDSNENKISKRISKQHFFRIPFFGLFGRGQNADVEETNNHEAGFTHTKNVIVKRTETTSYSVPARKNIKVSHFQTSGLTSIKFRAKAVFTGTADTLADDGSILSMHPINAHITQILLEQEGYKGTVEFSNGVLFANLEGSLDVNYSRTNIKLDEFIKESIIQ